MRKLLIFIVLLTFVTAGCSMTKASENNAPARQTEELSNTGSDKGTAPKNGIVSNSYKFETIALENAPQKIIDIYENNKETIKVAIADDGEFTYIISMMGQKPTAGYSIKVVSIEDNEEGKLRVTIKSSEPDKDTIVAQVITYPVEIVRIPKTNLPIYAVDTEGKEIVTLDMR